MASLFRIIMIYCILLSTIIVTHAAAAASNYTFNQNYYPYWGLNHFNLLQGAYEEAQLLIDQSSGAGFRSKLNYESGWFHMMMKIPEQKTGGLIPNFYLTSGNNAGIHSELDFEFVGTTGVLLTNLFASDVGGREQKFKLWFDPSEDFHSYDILWNQHQIVFYVDNKPIRVYKNNSAIGARFPSEPMRIEATIWNAEWAGPVNWTLSPFATRYRHFNITGCPEDYSHTGKCYSLDYYWNRRDKWDLSSEEKEQLKDVRNIYMFYDYCEQSTSTAYPECSISDE